jgi:tetratricopeptide (TPR) repeat protein
MTELGKLDGSQPAVAESKMIVETLRALGDTKDPKAAWVILDFSFKPDGIAFRDEVGRNIRKMSPQSLPALIKASGQKRRDKGSWSRYASYQLDRLDKARPAYALKAAPDDELLILMLDAIREVKHADAVDAVLEYCNSNSHAVRKAARAAWLAYVTGPPPPPAPKAKRKLPGGKLTEEEMPLYLTYRELATETLKRELLAVEGKEPGKRETAEDMTKRLFALYDARREALWDGVIAEATEAAKGGDWAKAVEKYDRILLADPFYGKRAEFVTGYLELGRAQAKAKDWAKAAVSLNKALSIDPKGPNAKVAEGELYTARAMQAKAEGRSAEEDIARANQAGGGETFKSALAQHLKSKRGWMLYAGVGTGALALALFALILLKRRGVE